MSSLGNAGPSGSAVDFFLMKPEFCGALEDAELSEVDG